ncbi:hypothetical protein [Sorangium cellulosum]|uniref:Uncharacterized protein n=1 Tax=Sorangium cellulosum So0157-2 TaxID=1254432 RepID=S4Y3M4_SORCE|nr:hypothetical protein [Sorangium cellulosum]AGP37453.1 hypothetical protein SCE1572_24950 [Sorangium cellulosum So0157-2]
MVDREIAQKVRRAQDSVAAGVQCASRPGITLPDTLKCVEDRSRQAAVTAASPDAGPAVAGPVDDAAAAQVSKEFQDAVARADQRFRATATTAKDESDPAVRRALDELDQDLQRATADELMRQAASAETGATSADTGSQGAGGGQTAQLATLLFAAGCMAYTGSVQGCALAAQFLSSLFGDRSGGAIDVERARRISEGGKALAEGTCDAECLVELYESSGAREEVERQVGEAIDKQLGPERHRQVMDAFRIFRCIDGIRPTTGTAIAAALGRCGVIGKDAAAAARVISNCHERGGLDCANEAAKCLVYRETKWTWSCE